MLRFWHPPFRPGAGNLPEFNVGTARYVAHWRTGQVDVAEAHVEAARQSGYVPIDHPQAVAGLVALGGR